MVRAHLSCQSVPGICIVWRSSHHSITHSPQDRVRRPVTPPGADAFTGSGGVGSRTLRPTPRMDTPPTRTSPGHRSCAGHGAAAQGRAANRGRYSRGFQGSGVRSGRWTITQIMAASFGEQLGLREGFLGKARALLGLEHQSDMGEGGREWGSGGRAPGRRCSEAA